MIALFFWLLFVVATIAMLVQAPWAVRSRWWQIFAVGLGIGVLSLGALFAGLIAEEIMIGLP